MNYLAIHRFDGCGGSRFSARRLAKYCPRALASVFSNFTVIPSLSIVSRQIRYRPLNQTPPRVASARGLRVRLERRCIERWWLGLAALPVRPPWPLILSLLLCISPAAIARFIVAVWVYSIQRIPRRARSHVGEKRLE